MEALQEFHEPGPESGQYLTTLELATVSLDIYQSIEWDSEVVENLQTQLNRLWPAFWDRIHVEKIPQEIGLRPEQTWEAELTFIDNAGIQQLNGEYRGKDQPTDVLTFCLFADRENSKSAAFASLPIVSLGSIFVSLPWAKAETAEAPDTFDVYVLERIFHGFLHLLGAHHDTMPDYERVKSIQTHVLSQLNATEGGGQA